MIDCTTEPEPRRLTAVLLLRVADFKVIEIGLDPSGVRKITSVKKNRKIKEDYSAFSTEDAVINCGI